jgi:hypothetical protein
MPETFTPKDWQDGPGGGTPITEAELDRMEAGIESMDDRVTALEDLPINAQTGTTYTPVAGDKGKIITLSNAAAITVTLPSNATAAIAIGGQITFVWLGVGQPTFVAGSGATVNSDPGLKIAARYTGATAIKISTDGWLLLGRLAA